MFARIVEKVVRLFRKVSLRRPGHAIQCVLVIQIVFSKNKGDLCIGLKYLDSIKLFDKKQSLLIGSLK